MLTDFFAAYLEYLVKQVNLAAKSAEMMKLKNRLVHQAEIWGKICNYLEVEIWSRIKIFEDDKIGNRISPESAQILQDRQQSTRIRRCHITTALPGHHLASQDQSEAAKSVPRQHDLRSIEPHRSIDRDSWNRSAARFLPRFCTDICFYLLSDLTGLRAYK